MPAANLTFALTFAARALDALAGGRALDEALAQATRTSEAAERAAAQDIAYNAARRFNQLAFLEATLFARPTPALSGLARAALSELIEHPERAHTVVNCAVNAAASIKGGRYRTLMNAVLRRFLRERDALMARMMEDEALRLTHPAWWIARLQTDWPEHWQAIVDASNQRAPMCVRVNRRRALADWPKSLDDQGFSGTALSAQAYLLASPTPVASLPGFAEGAVSVQDFSAQQAALLLDIADGMRVLDACAAPGGKTAHIAELADVDLLALDLDANRLVSAQKNIARLKLDAANAPEGLRIALKAADAAQPGTWWDGRAFDRILLDAPCSASGVIRRHPDGKWLKRAGDLDALTRTQAALLDALWQTLKPDGKLLYATCSVFRRENAAQVESFLLRHRDAKRVPAPLPFAHIDGQAFPHATHDGFFYAILAKHA